MIFWLVTAEAGPTSEGLVLPRRDPITAAAIWTLATHGCGKAKLKNEPGASVTMVIRRSHSITIAILFAF